MRSMEEQTRDARAIAIGKRIAAGQNASYADARLYHKWLLEGNRLPAPAPKTYKFKNYAEARAAYRKVVGV